MVLSTDAAHAHLSLIRRARYTRSAVFNAARRVAFGVALSAQAQQIRDAILALASCGGYLEEDHVRAVVERFRPSERTRHEVTHAA